MLCHENRLTKSSEFRYVQMRGRKYVGQFLIARACKNDGQCNRFGFSVSEKVGRAVQRNKVKRRLREAVRRQSLQLENGWDVVVIARPESVMAHISQIEHELSIALQVVRKQR